MATRNGRVNEGDPEYTLYRHIVITREPKFTVKIKQNGSVTQRVPSLSNAAKFIKTTKNIHPNFAIISGKVDPYLQFSVHHILVFIQREIDVSTRGDPEYTL